MAHGSGGRATSDLINSTVIKHFGVQNPESLQDYAKINFNHNVNLAFTTDSFVVNPIFFPGGNIGTLAVNGTINDLLINLFKSFVVKAESLHNPWSKLFNNNIVFHNKTFNYFDRFFFFQIKTN